MPHRSKLNEEYLRRMIPMANRIVLNPISYHGKGAIENIVYNA